MLLLVLYPSPGEMQGIEGRGSESTSPTDACATRSASVTQKKMKSEVKGCEGARQPLSVKEEFEHEGCFGEGSTSLQKIVILGSYSCHL